MCPPWRTFFISGICLLLIATSCVLSVDTPTLAPGQARGSTTMTATSTASATVETRAMATLTYTMVDSAISNPERGFYRHLEVHADHLTPYSANELAQIVGEGTRLIGCINYLVGFVNSPLSNEYLELLQTNLNLVREAELKCILRFAYTNDDPTQRGEEPPFGDATKERIEAHIDQLEPILRANADVIAHVQAGFIGVWGEWYYTDHFVDNPALPWQISSQQHARRLEVLTTLLDALPTTRTVSIRYPVAKQLMLDIDTPLNGTQAHNATLRARIGYHNDCFLASPTDYGTFRDGQIEADKEYLAAETHYLPMGGESCNPNPLRSSCPVALAELALFHWSYLNRDYHPSILATWQSQGCFAEIEQRLGYRLELQSAELPTEAHPGGTLPLHIHLRNSGFAAPFNPRPVELVLRNVQTKATHALPLPVDLRFWLPGVTHTIDYTATLPATLPVGDYELLLHLPDAAPGLRSRPLYAIQLANENTWEAATGYNRLLHHLSVVEADHQIHLPFLTQ